jgi:hypothetical protein
MKTSNKSTRRAFSLLAASVIPAVLTGCSPKEETVSLVILHDFPRPGSSAPFSNAVIIEKKTGYIKFRAVDTVYEHSGRYTIRNQVDQ